MTHERYQRLKEVVATALEQPAAERAAFVAGECEGDTELRREVESMLAQSGSRVEQLVDNVAATKSGDGLVGARLGAYKVVREIGRGGMGAVYLGQRADREFEKQVAIKVLKRGTDTDEVLRRFRSERQILARLEHPNIARLLDAGTTSEGLPYFVMEYVEGVRITEFCEQQNLAAAARVELFLPVCEAVGFAHRNLIVHRDLKPANVLVTPEGEPKLLDFGIAKLIDSSDAPVTVTAADRQRLTPAYASPEQVRGDAVTTMSDVYALGALLYELLAGTSPHRFKSPRPSPTELLHVVTLQEPARPSAIAREPAQQKALRGDLDRIVMKALRKEPLQRYRGVGSFAEDIHRYLRGLPVQARPATFGYRAGKFIRRHKVGVAAGVLVVLTALGGTITTISNARRAQREAEKAALEAKRAESEALRAGQHFEDVRQLTNSFLFEFHDAIAALPGATGARQLVVSRALEYLEKLGREAASDRELQLERAEAYLRIGDVQGKPYTANLGDSAGAIRSYQAAIAIAEPFAATEEISGKSDARRLLGNAYLALAAVQARANQLDAAAQSNRRARELAERLLRTDPAHADDWRRMLASSHFGLGDVIQAGNHRLRDEARYRAAADHYREALQLAEQLLASSPNSVPELMRMAKACARLAGMLPGTDWKTGLTMHLEETLALHNRNLELTKTALSLEPQNAQLRRNLAGGLTARAQAASVANTRLDEAVADSARALEIFRELAAADPLNAEAQQDLSFTHYIAGFAEQRLGRKDAAAEHYRASIAILEPLTRAHPNNLETAYDLDQARRGLAETEAAGAQR